MTLGQQLKIRGFYKSQGMSAYHFWAKYRPAVLAKHCDGAKLTYEDWAKRNWPMGFRT